MKKFIEIRNTLLSRSLVEVKTRDWRPMSSLFALLSAFNSSNSSLNEVNSVVKSETNLRNKKIGIFS